MTSLQRKINPFIAARKANGPVSSERSAPRFVELPVAPRNASPVPHLTSLYHNADAGPYGDRRYPGNCGGRIIKDLIQYFGPHSVYDPMTGSGTCRDVCDELGIYCWSGDLHQGQDACNPELVFNDCFEFCWLHPPYWRQKIYSADPRDLSQTQTLHAFLEGYRRLLTNAAQSLVAGGRLAVLMGDSVDREAGFVPLVHHTKAIAFDLGLRQDCTDIIRFSHNASSSRKTYRSSFIPGLHDVCMVFRKPQSGT